MSLLSQFFQQNDPIVPDEFIDVELLMVAGGGGGGTDPALLPNGVRWSGMGGAGGLYYGNFSIKRGSTCPISIGGGGAGGGVAGGDGARGGNTTLRTPTGNFIVHGGGGGTGYPNPAIDSGQPGGSGGGGCYRNQTPTNYNLSTPAGGSIYGYSGTSSMGGGAGSRLGSPGRSRVNYYYPDGYKFWGGGAGGFNVTTQFTALTPTEVQQIEEITPLEWVSDITGTFTRYAFPGGPSDPGLGNGGAAGVVLSPGNIVSNPGGSGTVVIRYPTQFPVASAFPGGVDLSPDTPGYRTYQFTSPGSITIP